MLFFRLTGTTEEAPTLFRGNTFSSAMLSVYQRHTAQSYLHTVMQPLVKEMLNYKHSFEVRNIHLFKL